MSSQKKNNRRKFLRSFLIAGTALGAVTPLNKISKQTNKEKIKMLTADGKLVEVDKSVIEKNADLKRASDKEVFDWMTTKRKS
jgi:hypothetical protein